MKLSPKDKIELKYESNERLEKGHMISYHKKINALGKPKQPPNAYALYLKEVMSGVKNLKEANEEMKKGAVVWNRMSNQEKSVSFMLDFLIQGESV